MAPEKDCNLCPRLVQFRRDNQQKYPDWFNGAVPAFSATGAINLLIVGLAPGLQGANRTGRPFTGDWAGDLLYATMLKVGFATGNYDERADDTLKLKNCRVTNAVRCVPPQNKPVGAECNNCRPFLSNEISALKELKAIICLGRLSHENTLKALGLKQASVKFVHGSKNDIDGPNGPLALFDSYHCSRYNTNTGRLTEAMFEAVFNDVKAFLA